MTLGKILLLQGDINGAIGKCTSIHTRFSLRQYILTLRYNYLSRQMKSINSRSLRDRSRCGTSKMKLPSQFRYTSRDEKICKQSTRFLRQSFCLHIFSSHEEPRLWGISFIFEVPDMARSLRNLLLKTLTISIISSQKYIVNPYIVFLRIPICVPHQGRSQFKNLVFRFIFLL